MCVCTCACVRVRVCVRVCVCVQGCAELWGRHDADKGQNRAPPPGQLQITLNPAYTINRAVAPTLQLKRRVAPRIFSAALGFQPNPLAPLPGSPALTETSMPLWALRDVGQRALNWGWLGWAAAGAGWGWGWTGPCVAWVQPQPTGWVHQGHRCRQRWSMLLQSYISYHVT